jgi:zinc protease
MVRAWHACETATGRSTVVAVGELDPERLADQLAGIFGGGPERPPLAQLPRSTWRGGTPGHLEAVVERTRKQSALALLYPGPGRSAPERHAAEVWAAIASGLGGRLFTALRDRRSLAYTVMASSWQRAGAGALLLYLATSPAREAEARAALLEELERFRQAPAEPEELTRAISYLAGQAQVGRQTASAVAGEIAEAWLLGEGLAELEDPAAGYRSVTASRILALAASALAPSLRVEGIVRGREESRAEYVSGVQGPEPA